MSQQDPKTRHLSRAELAQALRGLHEPEDTSVETEPKTSVWSRVVPPAAGSREPATQLEVRTDSKSRGLGAESNVTTDRIPALIAPSRALVTRIGIGALVVGCAWWVGLRPPPPSTASAKFQVAAHAPSVLRSKPKPREDETAQPPLNVQPPSRRAAVDLLLAGRQREALDAYRALAVHQPNDPSFAALITQLERELSHCEQESGPCVR